MKQGLDMNKGTNDKGTNGNGTNGDIRRMFESAYISVSGKVPHSSQDALQRAMLRIFSGADGYQPASRAHAIGIIKKTLNKELLSEFRDAERRQRRIIFDGEIKPLSEFETFSYEGVKAEGWHDRAKKRDCIEILDIISKKLKREQDREYFILSFRYLLKARDIADPERVSVKVLEDIVENYGELSLFGKSAPYIARIKKRVLRVVRSETFQPLWNEYAKNVAGQFSEHFHRVVGEQARNGGSLKEGWKRVWKRQFREDFLKRNAGEVRRLEKLPEPPKPVKTAFGGTMAHGLMSSYLEHSRGILFPAYKIYPNSAVTFDGVDFEPFKGVSLMRHDSQKDFFQSLFRRDRIAERRAINQIVIKRWFDPAYQFDSTK